MATIKEIVLDEKVYNYVEYEDGSTTIDTIKLVITDEIRNYLNTLQGFIGKLLDPKDHDEMTIINVNVPAVGEFTAISKSGELTNIAMSSLTMDRIKEKLKNIDYEVVNSLQEIYYNPSYKLDFILKQYVNHKNEYDTGVHINGKMIHYGEAVIPKGNESQIIDEIAKLDYSKRVYKNIPITNMKFKLHKPNNLNADVQVNFDINGKPITAAYCNIALMLGKAPTDEEYEFHLNRIKVNSLHLYALNRKLNEIDDEDMRNEVLNDMWDDYSEKFNSYEKGNFALFIQKPILNELIKKDLIEKDNEDSLI